MHLKSPSGCLQVIEAQEPFDSAKDEAYRDELEMCGAASELLMGLVEAIGRLLPMKDPSERWVCDTDTGCPLP